MVEINIVTYQRYNEGFILVNRIRHAATGFKWPPLWQGYVDPVKKKLTVTIMADRKQMQLTIESALLAFGDDDLPPPRKKRWWQRW